MKLMLWKELFKSEQDHKYIRQSSCFRNSMERFKRKEMLSIREINKLNKEDLSRRRLAE